MPFLRLQLDSVMGSRVQEAEKKIVGGEKKFFFWQRTYFRDFRSPQKTSSFLLDLFQFLPYVLFANAALNYTAYAIFFFFFFFFLFLFYSVSVLVSPVYCTRPRNWIRGRIKKNLNNKNKKKDSLKIKERNGGSSLVLTMFFLFVFKEAFVWSGDYATLSEIKLI